MKLDRKQASSILNRANNLTQDLKMFIGNQLSVEIRSQNIETLKPFFRYVEEMHNDFFKKITDKIETSLFVYGLSEPSDNDVSGNDHFEPVIMIGEIEIKLHYRVISESDGNFVDDVYVISVTGAGEYNDIIKSTLALDLNDCDESFIKDICDNTEFNNSNALHELLPPSKILYTDEKAMMDFINKSI